MTRVSFLALITFGFFCFVCSGCSSSDSDKDQGVNSANSSNDDGGGDGATNSETSSDASDEEDYAVDEPFGRVCKLGDKCPDDPQGYPNVCVAPEEHSPGLGFCTRTCNDEAGGPECFGVPNGQWASCLLKGPGGDAGPGLSYCIFICKLPERRWTCPGTLTCGEEKDEVSLCVPK